MEIKGNTVKAQSTVFVVDDDPAILSSLTYLVRSVRLPVEVFASARAFLAEHGPHRRGCLVLDLRIPEMGGLELQRKLLEIRSTLPVIVLTGHADVPVAVQALQAGAFDFMEKPFQNHKLLETIQIAIRHDRETHERLARQGEIESRLASLTEGERRTLDRMMAGKGYKAIAKDLGISYRTVQARRTQIMKKMKTDDLPGLACLLAGVYQIEFAA